MKTRQLSFGPFGPFGPFGVLGILVFSLSCLVIGCAGGPPPSVEVLPASQYDIIGPDFDWVALDESMEEDDILLIERIDNHLGILKKKHRSVRRAKSAVRYAGAIVDFKNYRSSTALSDHRLVGMGSDSKLVNSIAQIRNNLSRFKSSMTGITVLVDSVEVLTDAQLRALVSAPATCLVLDGLHYVTTEQAKIIAGFEGRALSLNEVMWIGCPQIRELGKFKGDFLSLNGIRTLTDEQALDLRRYEGKTVMVGSIDDASKTLLARHRRAGTSRMITSLD